MCNIGGGIKARHDRLKWIIAGAASTAKIRRAEVEPQRLLRGLGRRHPGDVATFGTVINDNRQCLVTAYDVSVTARRLRPQKSVQGE